MRRTSMIPSGVLVLLTGVGLLTSCSPTPAGTAPPTDAPTEVRGIDMRAELDEESGAVVLPADRFVATILEEAVISAASSRLIGTCAAEQGVEFVPAEPILDPVYLSEPYYGPWTMEQARTFGFIRPMSTADMRSNGYIDGSDAPPAGAEADSGDGQLSPNEDLSDADWQSVEECEGSVDGKQALDEARTVTGPWARALIDIEEDLVDDPVVADAIDDLAVCLKDRHVDTAKEAPWAPEGANPHMLSEDQIRLAVTTVECKQEVDFTRRVADLHAARQAVVIAEYADEMVEHRAAVDEALEGARELGVNVPAQP